MRPWNRRADSQKKQLRENVVASGKQDEGKAQESAVCVGGVYT